MYLTPKLDSVVPICVRPRGEIEIRFTCDGHAKNAALNSLYVNGFHTTTVLHR